MSSRAERFYADEPLFAVLNADRYRSASLTPDLVAEFFDSGEEYVSELLVLIRTALDHEFTLANVLEFGCGPGRLAIPFARHARRVVAVDISPAMLHSARRFARELGADNIELLSSDEFERSERFDLVNRYLMLQRLAQDKGLQIIRALLGRTPSFRGSDPQNEEFVRAWRNGSEDSER
jgi:2-polyprenyl-3-methyl-5-hydroxy-6-metoxy-1,4-benzoquinol methylase